MESHFGFIYLNNLTNPVPLDIDKVSSSNTDTDYRVIPKV